MLRYGASSGTTEEACVVGEQRAAGRVGAYGQAIAQRSVGSLSCPCLLACAAGASNAAVAAKLRTTGFTVGLWRNRFIAEGVVGLGDEPRPGAPREMATRRSSRWCGSR